MIEKIFEHSINNHYTKRYINLVSKLSNLERTIDIYEVHHILPKSLFPEYLKNKNNLIKLKPREHFILHKILAKAIGGKMLYAFNMMCVISPTQSRDFKISSLDYEFIKTILRNNNPSKRMDVIEKISLKAKQRWSNEDFYNKMIALFNSEEHKSKISNTSKERWDNPEYREKQCKERKERWDNPEYRNKVSNGIKKYWETYNRENKNQQSSFKKRNSAEWSEDRRKDHSKRFSGENNPFYGKTHTDETKQKIAEKNRGKVASIETRKKLSKSLKGKKKSEAFKENLSKARTGIKIHTDESKQKISDKAKQRCEDPSYLKKMSEAQKNGKREACIHCGKVMNIGNLVRHHNDNCKFKRK